MDVIDVVRCKHCRFAEPLEGECGLVCKVREGVGWFYVPDDGFCHLAEEKLESVDKCGDCKHYREHKHDHLGDRFDGVCCESDLFAFSTMSSGKACLVFEQR